MEGITILSERAIKAPEPYVDILFVVFTIIATVVYLAYVNDFKKRETLVEVLIIALIVISIVLVRARSYTEVKAYIPKETNFYDIVNNYEIRDRDGDLWILEAKEK